MDKEIKRNNKKSARVVINASSKKINENDFSNKSDSTPYQSQPGEPIEPASPRQLSTIADLVDNPFINDEERLKLSNALEHEISKSDAKEILNYFLGKSEYVNGAWIRAQPGVIDKRKDQLPD